jgi:hypothetical protein
MMTVESDAEMACHKRQAIVISATGS